MSITDVAMNSGFSSLSAFNRTFKTVKYLFAERLPQTAGVDGTGFADAWIKGLVFHTLLC